MSYTLQGQKLREAIELLLDKMIKLGFIKPDEKESLVEKLTNTLEAAHPNGQVPVEVFNHPVQQKKLMSLVICASIEKTLKDPALLKIFNTHELAKALFTPGEYGPQAKQQISAFILALKLPMPGVNLKNKADAMADEILAQKKRFDEEQYEFDADMELDNKLAEYLLAEFNYVQAFGNSPDGTPIVVLRQTSNTIGATDNTTGAGIDIMGYLNEDQNPSNPNVSPAVKSAIVRKKEELGIVMNDYAKELVDHRITPKMVAPAPGAPGSAAAG